MVDESKNPSNPFGIVPLSNFVPRGFGFVHHSIAILDQHVRNAHLTIRDFCIAVRWRRRRGWGRWWRGCSGRRWCCWPRKERLHS
jgi:hypothetical protein